MEGPNIFRSLFPVVDGMWPPPLRAMSSFFLGRSPVSVPAAPLPPRVPRTWISPLFGTVGREGGAALQLFAGPARLPATAHSPDGVGRERGREISRVPLHCFNIALLVRPFFVSRLHFPPSPIREILEPSTVLCRRLRVRRNAAPCHGESFGLAYFDLLCRVGERV